MILRYKLSSMLAVSMALLCSVQSKAQTPDNDEYTRLNPEVESLSVGAVDGQSENMSYLRRDLNNIDLNGDNWDNLKTKLEQSRGHATFTIAHIGDSHLQGDGNTGTTRRLLQEEYGDAGRGVIIPFKLAGTNEPRDYKITSSSPFTVGKIMKRPWPVEMAFTGITLRPKQHDFAFDISVKDNIGYFNILSSGNLEVSEVLSGDRSIPFETRPVNGGHEVYLDEDVSELTLKLKSDDIDIFGFDLRNDNHGVVYHCIGNNGAQFQSYNGIQNFATSLAALEPDLVILSLGSNEAFGNLQDDAFTGQIDRMVKNIREAMPKAKILLTTPSECQRSTSGAKGKSYQINHNVARVRDLIMKYATSNNIPVYDFYNIAGGEGASNKWLADKLLANDRIHRTWYGYKVDGTLMYEALIDALAK